MIDTLRPGQIGQIAERMLPSSLREHKTEKKSAAAQVQVLNQRSKWTARRWKIFDLGHSELHCLALFVSRRSSSEWTFVT